MNKKTKEKVYRKGQVCYICKKPFNQNQTIDHQIPRKDGGGNSISNLNPCCKNCNKQKGICECILPNDCLTDNQKQKIIRAFRYFNEINFRKINNKLK